MKCLVCREEIASGAAKCVHCDSYQDWRRFMNLSTPILSLLIALISVLTVAVPVVERVLTRKKALVRLTVTSCGAQRLRMLVYNAGNIPALFERASVTVTRAS